MNWDAIGAIGEIVGAIAVLITLLYLARQIVHNTKLGRASQNTAIFDSYNDFNNQVLTSPLLADLLSQMQEITREITASEEVQLRHLTYRLLNIWTNIEVAYDNGQLSEDEFAMYKTDARVMFRTYPGLLNYAKGLLEQYPNLIDMKIYSPVREYAAKQQETG